MWSAIAQPTTIRVVTSITVARYSQPSDVRRYVMSPTRQVVATGANQSRRIRSGRAGAAGSGIVVFFDVLGWMPSMPSSRISLATSHNDTWA